MTNPIEQSVDKLAREIADGLTEAQRKAIVTTLGDEQIAVVRWEHFRSTKALFSKGLIGLNMTPGVLTPLGLAVRRIIAANVD